MSMKRQQKLQHKRQQKRQQSVTRLGPWAVVLALLPYIAPLQAADALTIEPGKWQITTKATLPMLQQPITHQTTECLAKDAISAKTLLEETDGECQVTQSSLKGNQLSWSMRCQVDGQQVTGNGQFVSHGNRASGDMVMTMPVQGIVMQMKTHWQAKRLGACH